jgi:carbon starvation protein
LFILTTIDAGTRVARFMLSDSLGNLGGALRRFKDPSWQIGAWLCTALVVAGWGSVLLMGVNDPLGGINTLYPLFGIANQLLAAIALLVVLVIVVKKGLVKWAWIPGLPLAWDLTVTMTASWQKIFSADPMLGYWKLHSVCRAAKAAHKGCSTAKTPQAVDAVIRNTAIQGTLSIVFAVLVLIVVATGVWAGVRALRSTAPAGTTETPETASRIFAPSGLIPTAAERDVQQEWDALDAATTVPGR